MIPKTIHYCWFGRDKKSAEVEEYIASWKKVMPDYEIIEWNEDNFDINKCSFSREAYEKKAYAFVSDYARMDILSRYGGIYMDVDMESIRPFDECLHNKCFFCFETEYGGVATCVIGAEPDNSVIRKIKEYYESAAYILADGNYNNTPNNRIVEKILYNDCGASLRGKENLSGDVYFYDWHVFHPLSLITGKLSMSDRTLAIHRHTLLWVPLSTKLIKIFRQKIFIPIFGERIYWRIKSKSVSK